MPGFHAICRDVGISDDGNEAYVRGPTGRAGSQFGHSYGILYSSSALSPGDSFNLKVIEAEIPRGGVGASINS